MFKLVVGLIAMFAVVGTMETGSLILGLLLMFPACAVFLKGAYELLEINTEADYRG